MGEHRVYYQIHECCCWEEGVKLCVTSAQDILCSRRGTLGELWLIPPTDNSGWSLLSQPQQHQGLLRNVGPWFSPESTDPNYHFRRFQDLDKCRFGKYDVCFLEHHPLHLWVQRLGFVFSTAILGYLNPHSQKQLLLFIADELMCCHLPTSIWGDRISNLVLVET